MTRTQKSLLKMGAASLLAPPALALYAMTPFIFSDAPWIQKIAGFRDVLGVIGFSMTHPDVDWPEGIAYLAVAVIAMFVVVEVISLLASRKRTTDRRWPNVH